MADQVFVVYALSHDSRSIFDLAAPLISGGNLGQPTHIAEPSDPHLSEIREIGKTIKRTARVNAGLDLKFAKLIRKHDLVAWAERTHAKVILPTP